MTEPGTETRQMTLESVLSIIMLHFLPTRHTAMPSQRMMACLQTMAQFYIISLGKVKILVFAIPKWKKTLRPRMLLLVINK